MKILIVDTESTGFESDAEVCEFAATLYQIGQNSGAIASVSTLLPLKGDNKAQAINRISPELAQDSESVFPVMVDSIRFLASQAHCAVAFSAQFDRPHWQKLITIPWVCAQVDFDWGYPNDRFSLMALAVWLGIGVSSAHRAGDDVRTLVECFNRVDKLEERFELAITRAMSPLIELQALVTYENRELASKKKFKWNGERKKWLKTVKECDFEEFSENCLDFQIEILGVVSQE